MFNFLKFSDFHKSKMSGFWNSEMFMFFFLNLLDWSPNYSVFWHKIRALCRTTTALINHCMWVGYQVTAKNAAHWSSSLIWLFQLWVFNIQLFIWKCGRSSDQCAVPSIAFSQTKCHHEFWYLIMFPLFFITVTPVKPFPCQTQKISQRKSWSCSDKHSRSRN